MKINPNAPHTGNYFSLFGLPEHYGIKKEPLKQAYFSAARSCHPDLFAQKSLAVQREMSQKMALLNQAFATLSDPFLRAQYLVKLWSPQGLPSVTTPIEFLEEQLELRESLEELAGQPCEAEKKMALKVKIQTVLAELEQQYAQILVNASALKQASNSVRLALALQRWPYYQRALAQLSL